MKRVWFKPNWEFDESDARNILMWRNQKYVRERMFSQHEIGWKEHIKHLHSLKEDQERALYIAIKDEEPFGVLQYEMEGRNLEFGYYLIREKSLGKGLGTILGYAMLEAAFNNLKVHEVVARIIDTNAGGINFNKRLGFTGKLEDVEINKMNWKIYHMSLSLERWLTYKPQIQEKISCIVPLDQIEALPLPNNRNTLRE